MTKPAGKNVTYGEGQGIINTKDGKDITTFRGYGIGQTNEQINAFSWSVFFKLSSSLLQMETFIF